GPSARPVRSLLTSNYRFGRSRSGARFSHRQNDFPGMTMVTSRTHAPASSSEACPLKHLWREVQGAAASCDDGGVRAPARYPARRLWRPTAVPRGARRVSRQARNAHLAINPAPQISDREASEEWVGLDYLLARGPTSRVGTRHDGCRIGVLRR